MAERAAWKCRVRKRVLKVEALCQDSFQRLFHAATLIRHPGDASKAAELLQGVSTSLTLAASYMQAAELLALRGGSPHPRRPLPSLADLHPDAADVRAALLRVQAAAATHEATRLHLQCCRGRLATLCFLLDRQSKRQRHGFHAVTEPQRAAAFVALENARHSLHACVMEINIALLALPP
ncbi:uncharacterized protein LOC106866168 [Brachypodium distachyon]|uniref:Uncharacterized protein n=1 Tax=Brachypodium distachyon TaxID=15368 RepID=I1HB24_BRADI|nr:uncharacterized protein LOC106866168 [Brachypodium distachyon]KQK02248.1 hypothetical protein BRADI_2g00350v3 [Brachypodium distachyon]|eukprot:XP_014754407.1 uncharacterized protein LOC106866168 [Brachypodium distachyon]